METWILVTLAAAAVQTLRFSLQKRLKSLGLSTAGATFSRFVFAFPLAIIAASLLIAQDGRGMPDLSLRYWLFAIAGGLGQIIATFCTVALFSERSFAVGITFTKTETVQVALFGLIMLGETVSPPGMLAIFIGLVGVVILSRPPQDIGQVRSRWLNRGIVLGLLAGGFFAISAIGYRGATMAIARDDVLLRAVLALACVTSFQASIMVVWLAWREPGQISKVLATWRATVWVGLTGVAGSLGWFVAFTLQNAAYVRSLGQVELLFSFLVSVLIFREQPSRFEVLGISLLVISIVMIVLIA